MWSPEGFGKNLDQYIQKLAPGTVKSAWKPQGTYPKRQQCHRYQPVPNSGPPVPTEVAYETACFSIVTTSEDIGSGQFSNIVRFLPPLTSPSRPATSAPPHPPQISPLLLRHKCPSPDMPRSTAWTRPSRIRALLLRRPPPTDPPYCFAPLAIAQAEHPD